MSPRKPTRAIKALIPHEYEEQIRVVAWLERNNIPFYHIPNGGKRILLEAFKLKRMGVKSGIPDICIPVARKSYHGAYGELKRVSGGIVSDHQRYWLDELTKQGYYCFVAEGHQEFINLIQIYLE